MTYKFHPFNVEVRFYQDGPRNRCLLSDPFWSNNLERCDHYFHSLFYKLYWPFSFSSQERKSYTGKMAEELERFGLPRIFQCFNGGS